MNLRMHGIILVLPYTLINISLKNYSFKILNILYNLEKVK